MITVIIPYYNSKRFITKTLESMDQQRFRDFKLIFIDDGSTDGTSEYVDDFFKNKKISYKIIKTEHCGVSHARNIGLEYIDTPYFMFLDSDDYIENDLFSTSIDYLVMHNLDAVFFSYDKRQGDRIVWEYSDTYQDFKGFIDGVSFLNHVFDNRFHVIISNAIYKSSLIAELKFNENSSFHEDIHFCYRVISRAKKVGFIPRVFTHYVIRKDSITNDLTIDKLIDAVTAIESLYVFLNENIEEKVARKAINQMLPETLLHFFKNLCIKNEIINVFCKYNYFTYMRQYKLSRKSARYFIKYFQIKWIAFLPNLYVFLWRIYCKCKNRI